MKAKTGAGDTTYDLTSVLYHALQGAQVYEQYVKDAESEGSKELAEFFREVQRQDKERAERAQSLLAKSMH